MVLCAVIGIVVYALRFDIASQGLGMLVQDITAQLLDNTGYPVALESTPLQMASVGHRVVVVTENTLAVYNTAGNRVVEQRLEDRDTLAVSAGKYLLSFAQGGYELTLRSGGTVVFQSRFDHPILTAAVAPTGAFAVAIGAVGDQSQVILYDNNYEQQFLWVSAERVIGALSLDSTATRLAVGGISLEDGVLCGSVSIFTAASGEQQRSETLSGELILGLQISDSGSVTAVTDRAVHRFAASAKSLGSYSYEGAPPAAFAIRPDGGVWLALGDYDAEHAVRLVLLDERARQKAALITEQHVKSLHLYGNDLLAYVGERALRFNQKLERQQSTETVGAACVQVVDRRLYYGTAAGLSYATIR